MTGWSGSTRRANLPRDWHAQRARTWRAAGGRCQATTDGQRCTWTGRLNGDGGQCDHINGRDDPTLQWLCPHHHNIKSSAEGVAARHSRRRPTNDQHPGLTR